MSLRSRLADRWPKDIPLQLIPKLEWSMQQPTYQDAQPQIIDAALQRALRRPSGNWYAFAASTDVRTDRPFGTQVDGVEIVAWRDQQRTLHVGPAACPHLGADLATGKVDCGGLICPWHGLRLDGGREFGWKPLRAYDDGVLVWVRLDAVDGDVGEGGGREQPLDAPVIRSGPPARRWRRWPGWREPANPVTSSPTVSTRGTARGSTRTRSPNSRCSAPRRSTPTRTPTGSWWR